MQFLSTGLVSITLTHGEENDQGECVIWGSQPGGVYKAIRSSTSIEVVSTADVEGQTDNLIAGAYTLLDAEGVFYAPLEIGWKRGWMTQAI